MKVSDVKIEKLGKQQKSESKIGFTYLFYYIVLLLLFYWIGYESKFSSIEISLVMTAFGYMMYDVFLEDWVKDLKIKYCFNIFNVGQAHSFLPTDQPLRFNEYVDRIATCLLAHNLIRKSHLKKLHNHFLNSFVRTAFGGVIFELFKSKRLAKNQWFILTDEKFYWGIVNEMIELGIIPVKTLVGQNESYPTVMPYGHSIYDYAIILESEEDFNLTKLNIKDAHNRYIGVGTNDILEAIDKVVSDKVDVWMEGYGTLSLCSNLTVYKSNHFNSIYGIVGMPISISSANAQAASASCGQKSNAAKKGP